MCVSMLAFVCVDARVREGVCVRPSVHPRACSCVQMFFCTCVRSPMHAFVCVCIRIDIRSHVRTEANTQVQTWELDFRS